METILLISRVSSVGRLGISQTTQTTQTTQKTITMKLPTLLFVLLCALLSVQCSKSGDLKNLGDIIDGDKTTIDGMKMVFVKGGMFAMGDIWGDGESDEEPVHYVTVSDFYIGKYEVTQAQWKSIMGSNPSNWKGDNLPVESVSWNDIQEFIKKLNAKTGKKYRLPTEAEWEYAARGGYNYKYSGSDTLTDVAWYYDNSGQKTHPVGQKRPNKLGVYDMSGNVWEWCQDWYGDYSSASQTSPTGPSSGSYRVLRGGSWLNDARSCCVSHRGCFTPSSRYIDLGFRLVLEP